MLFLCSRSSRVSDSITYFRRALSLDPFLWSAFQSLCQLGALPHSVIGPDSLFFKVDLSEFAAAHEGTHTANTHNDDASAAAPAPLLSPSRRSRPPAPLLTPASATIPHLHMLSLSTPTPRQALFSTPFTRDAAAQPATSASAAAAGSASFVTPPAAGAATATPTRTPARGKQGFSSPQAAKARPRGHVRAHSALSSSFAGSSAALAAASAATAASSSAASAAGLRSSRKVSNRLQFDSAPSSDARTRSGAGAGAAGSEYSSDDATTSERERNEKKVGRRINRANTQGEKVTSCTNEPSLCVALRCASPVCRGSCLIVPVCAAVLSPCVRSSRRLLVAQTQLTRRARHDGTSRRRILRCSLPRRRRSSALADRSLLPLLSDPLPRLRARSGCLRSRRRPPRTHEIRVSPRRR